MTRKKLREELKKLAEPDYGAFQRKLLPGLREELLGVRLPALRKLAKEIAKGEWRAFLEEEVFEETFEERMLQGMVLGYAPMEVQELQKRLLYFLPKVTNWSVCDSLCIGLKMTEHYKDEMFEFLKRCIEDGRAYHVRFGVVLLLDFYRQEKYLEEALSILDSIKKQEYYVRMAVAWALSMYYIAFPNQVESYFRSCTLDDFTYQKALSKVLESRQADSNMREKIKEMKKLRK